RATPAAAEGKDTGERAQFAQAGREAVVQPGDGQQLSGQRRGHEDGELDGDPGAGGRAWRDQPDELRRGDRVAVERVVQQQPAAAVLLRAILKEIVLKRIIY